jgi:hypothetical protein
MANYLERMIRRDMESEQTGQKMAGWVLILLGGGVLAAITFAVFANVFNLVEFVSMTVSLRIFLGIFVLLPILAFDSWLVRKVWQYRQSRKWLAEYERDNPLPYRTDED